MFRSWYFNYKICSANFKTKYNKNNKNNDNKICKKKIRNFVAFVKTNLVMVN